MDNKKSQHQGCLIGVLIVLGLGAFLLYVDYLVIATHTGPSFCSRPACEALRKMLNVSAASTVVALSSAVLAACNIGTRALSVAASGALLISVVTGFLTGESLWSLPNAAVTIIVTWLLLLLVADQ